MLAMKRECRFFCMLSASDAHEDRHPQVVVRELAATHGFFILGAVPQSLFDGWDFWIEYPTSTTMDLPSYFYAKPWKPIGQP